MEPERLIALVLFGLLHWVLVVLLLQDLAGREKVIGGHKAPWAIAIILIVYIGSILYILCHPGTFYERDKRE